MKTGERGIRLIKEFEGLRLSAYRDSVGVLTIGYGSTSGVSSGMMISEAEADSRLRHDLETAEKCVNQSVAVPITQNQFDALVSFVFNLGCGNLRKSTLLLKLNAGEDTDAADEFLRWNRAGGEVLHGLTRRREAERRLFLEG